ncbi:MAG: glycosyltransferase [Planctomycetes bacterium]|nr:glycosyltransferase [Planctomycetota bacterium]
MDTPRKINVLHLRSSRGAGGGPEKTILFSAKEADPDSFCLHIAYLKSHDDDAFDLDVRAQKLGIDRFYAINERHKLDIRALKELLRILREQQIDILHCHCYKSDLYGLILSRYYKMKLVTTAHGPLASLRFFWASQNWRVRYIYDQLDLRFLMKRFDAVLMVSESMRKAIAKYGVDQRKLIYVKNAIDSQYFRSGHSGNPELRDRYGIPRDATVIGAVGRLNGEKDYPMLLRAAQLLLKDRQDLWFVIAGDGPIRAQLQGQAKKMALAERVLFLGNLQDVRPVYEMLDVYVLSSTREGLPNTVLEAMAMEVPIVATDVDGVAEAVTHDSEALLVPPRDPERLANSLRLVLDDARLRDRLVSAARERVEREFSFATRMRRVESIYRQVMQMQHEPAPAGAVC